VIEFARSELGPGLFELDQVFVCFSDGDDTVKMYEQQQLHYSAKECGSKWS
jgi:hypothetical protein